MNEWIKVEDQLPDKFMEVWVTIKCYDYSNNFTDYYVYHLYFHDGLWCTQYTDDDGVIVEEDFETIDGTYSELVIAWKKMDYPSPYLEESQK